MVKEGKKIYPSFFRTKHKKASYYYDSWTKKNVCAEVTFVLSLLRILFTLVILATESSIFLTLNVVTLTLIVIFGSIAKVQFRKDPDIYLGREKLITAVIITLLTFLAVSVYLISNIQFPGI